MNPATAIIVREIRKFQKEHGLTMKAVSVGAGLSQPTVASWCRGHCGSTPRTRHMVRQYMREYSRNAPKARQVEWDDEFVSAYQSAHAFKVETPVHPGVFQRLVAPVRKLFSRGAAA